MGENIFKIWSVRCLSPAWSTGVQQGITTLNQYNRLPFGIKCAPVIFQQIIDAMLRDLPFALVCMDDIMSKTLANHTQNLDEVLNRIRNFGFTLRITKCSFFLPSLHFIEFIIDENGHCPDPSKGLPITKYRDRQTTELQSLLGLIKYDNFILNIHNKSPIKWIIEARLQMAFVGRM